VRPVIKTYTFIFTLTFTFLVGYAEFPSATKALSGDFFQDLDRGIVEVAADTRKMSFRYSGLCGMSSDTVAAVRSTIPQYRWEDVCNHDQS